MLVRDDGAVHADLARCILRCVAARPHGVGRAFSSAAVGPLDGDDGLGARRQGAPVMMRAAWPEEIDGRSALPAAMSPMTVSTAGKSSLAPWTSAMRTA